MSEKQRIHLCLAKMSDTGAEQRYIQEAFETNWVAPLGPNVDVFEKDLEAFVNELKAVEPSPCHSQGGLCESRESMGGKSTFEAIDPLLPLKPAAGMTWLQKHKQAAGMTCFPKAKTYDSNYWLCTITLDPDLKIKGQENAYKTIVQGAVGGAAGVIHAASSAVTDCQPNDNVEALRVFMDAAGIEARPLWKPMHKQPCYKDAPAYLNGVSEAMFKVGMCLPAGPYVSDEDVKYIVDCIKSAIV